MNRPRWQRLRTTWRLVRWALAEVRAASPRLFIAAAINAGLQAFLPLLIVLSVRGLVNSVSRAAAGTPLTATGALHWLLLGFAATLASSLCYVVHGYAHRRFELQLRPRLNLAISRHHTAMSLPRMESEDYLNALQRAQDTAEQPIASLYSAGLELLVKTVQMLSLLTVLVTIEPLLLLLLIPIGLPNLVFRWKLVRRQFRDQDSRVQQERRVSYYARLITDLDQAGEIRLLAIADTLIARYGALLNMLRSQRLAHLNQEVLGNLLFSFFSVLAIYLALLHLVPAVLAGRYSIGDLAIFGGAASQLRGLVDQNIGQMAFLRWQLLKVENLWAYFQIPVARPVDGPRAALERLKGRIELREVRFRYPGAATYVLDGLSFCIEPGETVALVGTNGAGKSTVAKLLAGLYDVQEGALLFDGHDSRQLDRRQLQRQIACVFQQFGRYQTTAAEALAFGDWPRLDRNPAAIEAVARRARVHDMISAMPDGYATVLGRLFGRYQPSGGQWQQLAIARLIGRDASILILDEPTANLDMAAEAALFERFRALAAGRTTLLISHRFATVSMADRILVLDQGRLVESGSHQELMALQGRYAALFGLANRFPEPTPTP